ncbi:hypothetical protein CEPID_06325 [Corynebacterium epidermidicanis]|uniref:Uncharacterized protein n=1 Tax=Corynebacterium epidermidicanis TaxID=1050174 RepID=A0A0G3GRE3_9CORY|nr:hypothetical protein CEPID_06325 [Corynebacterium epidermidicanis]
MCHFPHGFCRGTNTLKIGNKRPCWARDGHCFQQHPGLSKEKCVSDAWFPQRCGPEASIYCCLGAVARSMSSLRCSRTTAVGFISLKNAALRSRTTPKRRHSTCAANPHGRRHADRTHSSLLNPTSMPRCRGNTQGARRWRLPVSADVPCTNFSKEIQPALVPKSKTG